MEAFSCLSTWWRLAAALGPVWGCATPGRLWKDTLGCLQRAGAAPSTCGDSSALNMTFRTLRLGRDTGFSCRFQRMALKSESVAGLVLPVELPGVGVRPARLSSGSVTGWQMQGFERAEFTIAVHEFLLAGHAFLFPSLWTPPTEEGTVDTTLQQQQMCLGFLLSFNS